ncbi:NUDIX domain-containing protein [Amycolatopsis australiensis]|uniref:ADP-ribose pyrophosphatase YjhB, NUDIX family n=1 Tax=Amycolatopsis australiensis TaxID=546364 RepID=A0A1K1LL72_9PSEU|nr:NUDIX hydrolase [Amycolatopsis australiensis]SFW11653.1 ADP-ribose pyrophosphatase YjhB, NUDIX family [Amycolatopsis australiensis]
MAMTTVTDAHSFNQLVAFLDGRTLSTRPLPSEDEARRAFEHLVCAANGKLRDGVNHHQAPEIWAAILARLGNPVDVARTVDVVLLAERDGVLSVLLIRRRHDPFAGRWALPGGYVDLADRDSAREGQDDTEVAAYRELREETGLTAQQARLRRVGVYDTPGRDPRGPVASTVYTARLDHQPTPTAGSDAEHARWLPVSTVLSMPDQLAFDHIRILADVVDTPHGLTPIA